MSEFKLCVEVERKDSLKLNLSADGIKGDRDVSVKIYQNDSIKIKTDVKRKKTQMTPYVDGKKARMDEFMKCYNFNSMGSLSSGDLGDTSSTSSFISPKPDPATPICKNCRSKENTLHLHFCTPPRKNP